MFLLWLRQLPRCGDWTPASVPSPAEGLSCPINSPIFLPNSYVLPSFTWYYVFFSSGQVLLPALGWCSASTSVSEGVFLMYLWREIYSVLHIRLFPPCSSMIHHFLKHSEQLPHLHLLPCHFYSFKVDSSHELMKPAVAGIKRCTFWFFIVSSSSFHKEFSPSLKSALSWAGLDTDVDPASTHWEVFHLLHQFSTLLQHRFWHLWHSRFHVFHDLVLLF